ncbi:MAG: gamma-glutamyl-gamma-aminobutyrate hydrolase family protein [Pseudomonadota bacterium]
MVAVVCDRIALRWLNWSATPATYLEALAYVGLLPVQVPTLNMPLDPRPILDVVSGVLLTGSRSNVHPERYQGGSGEAAAPFDLERDRTAFTLIEEAVARGLPLFAICRGHQELNVAFGGTLHHAVHDLPDRNDHRSTPQEDVDTWFGLRHTVTTTPGGCLEPILGSAPVMVNSSHHQGIDGLAPRARVEATAPDGTIEAISITGAKAFTVGVQWHPEHFVKSDQPSAALFKAFAEAVHEKAAAREPAQ